jgi:signal transduction histidine kinase
VSALWRELGEQYTRALRDYLSNPEEAALERAYGLGRRALGDGLGILEMAALHQESMLPILRESRTIDEGIAAIRMAGDFFMESLGPFEMTQRGFREANAALLRLNERLEEEARRIAHALHDEAGQILACVYIALDDLGRDLPGETRGRIGEVRKLLDQIEEQLRRLSHELRPTVLDDLGLIPALEFLSEGVSKRTAIPIHVSGPREGRLPFAVETAVYRVVQEALNNIAKHAQARQAWIEIARQPGSLRCLVRDDGVGFDVASAAIKNGQRGLGLVGIRERIEVLGGTFQLHSEPGRGTEISIIIPLEV